VIVGPQTPRQAASPVISSFGEVRTRLRGTLERHGYPAEMIASASQFALLAPLSIVVGAVMIRLGLDHRLLESRNPPRRCPSCGRLIRRRVCPLCAGQTRGRLQPARARKGAG